MDYFVEIIEKKYKKKISENVRIMQKLLKECIDLKHILTATEDANLFLGDLFPDIDEDIKMDRVIFDKLCFHLFHSIEMVILGTLKEAGMSADKIDEIILVGGSSRIAAIKELVQKIFPEKKLNLGLNPDEAIAYGATLRATQISQQGVTNIIFNESNAKWLKNTNSPLTTNPSKNIVFATKDNTALKYNPFLLSAAQENNSDLVRTLLEKCADPNIRDGEGNTALHLVAKNKNDNKLLIELLLDYGADIDSQDKYGDTCLMFASYYNNIEIVRCLLQNGADINKKNSYGANAVYYASSNEKDNKLIIELLFKHGADIDCQAQNSLTCLMEAVYNNNIEIVRCLLQNNADINKQGGNGRTALQIAREKDNKEIVELLLSYEREKSKTFLKV